MSDVENLDVLNLNSINTDINQESNLNDSLMNNKQNDELYKKLKANYENVENKIKSTFELISSCLESRKSKLLIELENIYEKKKIFIDKNSNEMDPNSTILSNSIDFHTNDILNLIDLLKEDLNSQKKNSEFLNSIGPNSLELTNLINNYGKLTSKQLEMISNAVNLEYIITGRGLKQCFVNEETSFVITFKNLNGFNSPRSNTSFIDIFIVKSEIEVSLQTKKSTLTNKSRITTSKNSTQTPIKYNCECKLECTSDGVYEVKYKLNKKGTYFLHVLVNKNHIAESPYKIECVDKVKKNDFNKTNEKFKSIPHIPTTKNSQNKENRLVTSSKMASTYSISQTPTARSASSSSLLLPTKSSNNKSRLTTITNNSANMKMFKSKTFLSNNLLKKNNDSKTNLACNYESSSSSVKSFQSDSLSSQLSPALSRTNISNTDIISGEDDFLFQIGRRGKNSSEFMNPQAVCATNDQIFVTDSNNQKIDVFTHSGEFKFTLASSIQNNKIIKRPCGIVSTDDGKILVVDYEYKWVNVFEENGKFIKKICMNKLIGPKGICLNKANQKQIIIADSKSNTMSVFDFNGNFLHRFGNTGSKTENLAGPQYVDCTSIGDIVVSDFYNHCIKIYDCNGNYKFSFGSNGSSQGQFNGPTGIAVDSKDNIIVVDWGNCRVQVFDKHGTFIRFVKCDINQLYGPQDLAIINDTIAIADSGNHCVKIFEYS